jgi:nucleotide-binding universal stress UspA family protein
MKTLNVTSHAGISLKNILFATDFSEASEAALPYAAAISGRYQSQLYLVHVISPAGYVVPSGHADAVTLESMHQAALADARERMETIASRLKTIPHQTYIREGGLWDSLSDIIEKRDINLLVVGTRGRTGVEKLVLGSKAEELLRQARCPVLTVGPNISGRARLTAIESENDHSVEISLRQIVYATDFSPESLAAASFATSLAQEFQAKLTLLHVLGKYTDLENRPRPIDLALQRLENLVPEEAGLWCSPKPAVQFGPPADCILQEAMDSRADLIVLGVRAAAGKLGAATHLPWATAHKVIVQAPCPVLTIPFNATLQPSKDTEGFVEFGEVMPMNQAKAHNRDRAGDEGLTHIELAAEIRRRAYELYELRGRTDGQALEDWIEAEADVTRPRAA